VTWQKKLKQSGSREVYIVPIQIWIVLFHNVSLQILNHSTALDEYLRYDPVQTTLFNRTWWSSCCFCFILAMSRPGDRVSWLTFSLVVQAQDMKRSPSSSYGLSFMKYTCRKISPSFVDRYKYTASRGTEREGKRYRIRRLAPPMPFPFLFPLLLWHSSACRSFASCINTSRLSSISQAARTNLYFISNRFEFEHLNHRPQTHFQCWAC
jgi:hypothetical protein